MNAVLVVPDRFSVAGETANSNPAGQGKSDVPFIRRPTRGIQIKEDTFATIRLVAGVNGQNISLVDAGSRRKDPKTNQPITIDGLSATDIYSNFLLQHVHEDRMEKTQILETFGEPYIFLYGERPRIITFQGVLLNTSDFNWEAEWWYNYDNYLRGTKAVENDARAFISYDTTLVSGYIISASAEKDSSQPYYLQFQFQLFLTDYTNVEGLGSPYVWPGQNALFNSGEGATEDQQLAISAAIDEMTPVEIQGRPSSTNIANFNKVPLSLADGLSGALAAVQGVWQQAQNVVNSVNALVAGMMNGDNIRVPVGFAGAMSYDDADSIPLLTQPQYGQSTKYTVYSDNDDEYVGVGTQYGSSAINVAGSYFPYESPDQLLTYDNAMLLKVTAQWAAAGFTGGTNATGISTNPVTAFLGPTATAILSRGLGLLATAGVSAVTKATTQPGSATSPFASGLNIATSLPK
jgi:hypothetical protein